MGSAAADHGGRRIIPPQILAMASAISPFARRAFTSSAVRRSAVEADTPHAGGMRQWKILSFVVALPGAGLCLLNAVLSHHDHEQAEFIPYEHLRTRTKRFPWGDGKKSLFHNAHVNALPDGYEEH